MSLTPKLLAAAVSMAFAGAASAANIENPAVSRALGLLQTHGAAAHASVNDRFISRDVIVDADGTEHVRFDRTYADLPVIGGDIVVHSRNGQLKSTSLTQRAALNVNTRAGIQADDAIVSAGTRPRRTRSASTCSTSCVRPTANAGTTTLPRGSVRVRTSAISS